MRRLGFGRRRVGRYVGGGHRLKPRARSGSTPAVRVAPTALGHPSKLPQSTEEPLSDPRSSARARCRAIGSVGRSRPRPATVDGRTDRGRNRRLFRRTPRPGEPRRAPRRRRPPRASGHLPTGYRQNRRRACAAAAVPWQTRRQPPKPAQQHPAAARHREHLKRPVQTPFWSAPRFNRQAAQRASVARNRKMLAVIPDHDLLAVSVPVEMNAYCPRRIVIYTDLEMPEHLHLGPVVVESSLAAQAVAASARRTNTVRQS